MGNTIKGGLYADDYIHAALFTGSEALEEKGLLKGLGATEPLSLLMNQFNFFNPNTENYQALKDFGILPWWVSEDAKLHFFRPLASTTHLFDYWLYPDNSHLMHLMNLLWYLLGLLAIFLFMKQLKLPRAISLLALLFITLDVSSFHVTSWVASRSMLILIATGFFCLIAYHKGVQHKGWYMLSLLMLTVSLFTAEGGIGICLYLGAYFFALDERPWLKRSLALAPFALLAIGWRIAYVEAGFGAAGQDFYVDPGALGFSAFLARSIELYPIRLFELFSGIDVASGQIALNVQQKFGIAGMLGLGFITWLLWVDLKKEKTLRFFFFAAGLSLIPSLTIALPARTLLLPHIGFAVCISWLLVRTLKQHQGIKKVTTLITAGLLIVMHGVIAFGFSAYMAQSTLFSTNMDRGLSSLPFDVENKEVIFLNAHKPFWLVFFAHEQARKQLPLPNSFHILATDFYTIEVERISQNQLKLSANPGFQYTSRPLTEQTFHGHYSYLSMHLMGLLRQSGDSWELDRQYRLGSVKLSIEALTNNTPSELKLTFDTQAPMVWVAWDQSLQRYKQVSLPAIGSKLTLQGLL